MSARAMHDPCQRTWAELQHYLIGDPCPDCPHSPLHHSADGCGVCIVQDAERKTMKKTKDQPVPRASAWCRVHIDDTMATGTLVEVDYENGESVVTITSTVPVRIVEVNPLEPR